MVAFKSLIILSLASVAFAADGNNPTNDNSSDIKVKSEMEKCAEKEKCDITTLGCKALCAGVPNPSANQINDTTSCVAACDQSNPDQYKTCSQNCINKHFRKVDIPAPKTNTTNDKNTTNATKTDGQSSGSNLPYAVINTAIVSVFFSTFIRT